MEPVATSLVMTTVGAQKFDDHRPKMMQAIISAAAQVVRACPFANSAVKPRLRRRKIGRVPARECCCADTQSTAPAECRGRTCRANPSIFPPTRVTKRRHEQSGWRCRMQPAGQTHARCFRAPIHPAAAYRPPIRRRCRSRRRSGTGPNMMMPVDRPHSAVNTE